MTSTPRPSEQEELWQSKQQEILVSISLFDVQHSDAAAAVEKRMEPQEPQSPAEAEIVDCSCGCDQIVKIIHTTRGNHFVAKIPVRELDKVDAEVFCTTVVRQLSLPVAVPQTYFRAADRSYLIQEFIPGPMLSNLLDDGQVAACLDTADSSALPSPASCDKQFTQVVHLFSEAGKQLWRIHQFRSAIGFTEYVAKSNEGDRVYSKDFLEYENGNKWAQEARRHGVDEHGDASDVQLLYKNVVESGDFSLQECRELVHKVKESADRVFPTLQVAVLNHGDFHPTNILVNLQCCFEGDSGSDHTISSAPSSSGKPLTIVDWADAHYAPPENDFDCMYGDYYGTPFWEPFICGYQHERERCDGSVNVCDPALPSLNMEAVEILGIKRLLWTTGPSSSVRDRMKRFRLRQYLLRGKAEQQQQPPVRVTPG
mmetsp:Transcript_35085/g.80808  ORF Transcript_35085/g.80808 Transcript_35085/m.80808 type:complete len:427 (-) Transcript_35085:23-1303(-)